MLSDITHSGVCVALYYRPPSYSSSILDRLCTCLQAYTVPQFSNFILLGDFNVNLCSPYNYIFSKLECLSHLFTLTQVVTEPTRTHHNGSTGLIDLVFVSNSVLIDFCHVIPPLSNSDHKSISVQCKWKSTSKHNCVNHSKGRVVWFNNQADWEMAHTLIDIVDWYELLSEDVNETWLKWSQQFMCIMGKYIPQRTLPKCKNLPWLTKRLISLSRKRNALFKRGKVLGNLSRYKHLHNVIRLLMNYVRQKRHSFRVLTPGTPKNSGWQLNTSGKINLLSQHYLMEMGLSLTLAREKQRC